MKRINLGSVNARGVWLSPHEAIAVVHQVCELLKHCDERGQPLAPPALSELFINEDGTVEIEPKRGIHEAGSKGSFKHLIDELLPLDRLESEKTSISDARAYGRRVLDRKRRQDTTQLGPSGSAEQDTLRQLFQRAEEEDEPQAPAREEATTPGIPIVFAVDSDVAFADEVERSTRRASDFTADAGHIRHDREHATYFDEAPAAEAEPDAPEADAGGPTFDERAVAVAASQAGADFRVADDPPIEESAGPRLRYEPLIFSPRFQEQSMPGGRRQLRTLAAAAVILNVTVGLVFLKKGDVDAIIASLSRGAASAGTDRGEAIDADARAPDEPASEALALPKNHPAQSLHDDAAVSSPSPQNVVHTVHTSSPATAAEIAALRRKAASGASEAVDEAGGSSAGGLLAFADDGIDEPRGIYISRPDGTGAERVSGTGRAASPSWSLDKTWLAFVRTEPGRADVWNLWVYNVATRELRRLSSNTSGVVRGATWFPYGQRLCYGHGTTLTVIDLETDRTRRFPSPLPGRAIGRSSASPDGQQVAFALERDGVWLLDVTTGRMRRVIEDAGATDDVWWSGRSGRLLYYSLSTRGEGAWLGAPTSEIAALR